jgi:hypothetical protein
MRSFLYRDDHDEVFDWKTDSFFMSSLILNIITLVWTVVLYIKFQNFIKQVNPIK